MTPTQVVETSVSTNNSPSQDYTNPDDQPTTNTTLCCAVNTNCMTIITLTLKMTPTQVVETSVSTSNSPYQDYTNPDDQLTTNTTLCCKFQLYGYNTIDSEDDSHTGCRNVSHNQQQSISGLHQHGRSTSYKQSLYDFLLQRRANARNVSYTPNLTGKKTYHPNPC